MSFTFLKLCKWYQIAQRITNALSANKTTGNIVSQITNIAVKCKQVNIEIVAMEIADCGDYLLRKKDSAHQKFTCSKLLIKTLEKDVKHFQS